jgi:endonuclease YncB( thermonuclease family)
LVVIGLEQLRAGMAWYRQENAQQTAQERAEYEHAEFNAKIRRLGLWNTMNPTPPWDWRHGLPAH